MVDNSDFAKEFLGELKKPGAKKTLGKAIGLPDKVDEDFLMKLVADYERENPGWLAFMRDNARKMMQAGKGINTSTSKGALTGAVVNKDTYMTYDFELPPSFHKKIEDHYPLMFRDVDHYRWFKRTFSALMIAPEGDKRLKPARKK